MRLNKNSNQTGFTLVELLVSITLFTMVLTVTLGSILTIADSNKKARSLMSVMNNLNFAVDSISRSFKSGSINTGSPVTVGGTCVTTQETDYDEIDEGGDEFAKRDVKYCLVVNSSTNVGTIYKTVGGTSLELTSPDVDIDFLQFIVAAYDTNEQPALNIMMEGTVKVSPKIRSKFSIQTTVSQRQLNI